MKTTIKSFFTMVEIAIAVGILAVGAVAVVTLIPVGINQKKSAIGENYAAIFTSDTQSYLSKMADANTLDGLKAKIPDAPNFSTNIIKEGSLGNDLYSAKNKDTNMTLNGVYIVSKESGGMEDYSGQVVVWRTDLERKITTTSFTTTTTGGATESQPVFNITSGTVSNTAVADISMKSLGSEFKDQTGKAYEVRFHITITEPGKAPYVIYPLGTGWVQTGSEWNMPNVPAGTKIVAAIYTPAYGKTYESTNTSHVKTLKNGDLIPADAPFYKDQASASAIIKEYVSTDGKTMKLGKDQVIYLMDGNPTDNPKGAIDFQDLVVVANLAPADTFDMFTPATGIGISPTNSEYAFEISSHTGKLLDMDMMKKLDTSGKTTTTPKYSESDFIAPKSVAFTANSLKMRTKNDDNATISIGGQTVNIDNKDILINAATTNSLNLKIWKLNKGNGQWQIQILPSSATMVLSGTNTSLVPVEAKTTVTEVKTPREINGVAVNVEISWPLSQLDYSKRDKVRYYTEYYESSIPRN